jgi:two-component system response regulator PhcR
MNERTRAVTTVLYVDDEVLAQKYFARTTGSEYRVLTASGADAAVDLIEREEGRIDVLVTDYRMPGRDGGNLLREVEQDYPHIVCILVTAYANKQILLETVNSGEVFRILEKPLDRNQVRFALRLAAELSLERASRRQRLMAIDEALGFLAHELNTPLAAISNFARGIDRRARHKVFQLQQQAEVANAATAIGSNARYCMTMLATFVESVQSASSKPVATVGNSARGLIASLLGTYPLSPLERACVRVEEIANFPINTLPNCVALVLSSLLGNALRAVRESDSPAICFTISADSEPKIQVRDNGHGIPAEIRERLLLDPVTTHSASGGSGWGLIFCDRIMKSFGGGVHVDSAPGVTTVTLNFPPIDNHPYKNPRSIRDQ